MSFSRSFLQIKAENQNFPQITRIWLENWRLWSRINLWCKFKFTNVVLPLCWQMSKLTVWHFWFAYFHQHLLYYCSHISKKWQKQYCTPNSYIDSLSWSNSWFARSPNQIFFRVTYLIVYHVPRRIMRVITWRATMLAGDRSQGVAEAMPRKSQNSSNIFSSNIYQK